ncbi:Ig-like protein [Catenovulum agarivorans DS-2]|uniref:Ig-like protein n=2 Tax=Catenovulum agarivorans TaxID=1172192 RepID=W7QCF4_9ALTE|nr:Ig-like protein [Catenovulum agarivorans DS-2]
MNLLKTSIVAATITTVLAGCGEKDKGFDFNFSGGHPVTFDSAVTSESTNENSGVFEIDLLAGAMVDGQPIDPEKSTIYIREFNFSYDEDFRTPQTSNDNFENNIEDSPFSLSEDGFTLFVDTDAFKDVLRDCDTTDVMSGYDDNDEVIEGANGKRDFPQSVTYQIQYVVDNGYNWPLDENGVVTGEPEIRTINLTISAEYDEVVGVEIFAAETPVDGVVVPKASTIPTYACNTGLKFESLDSTIAQVLDENAGTVKGIDKGETQIKVTSVEKPEFSAQAEFNVTPGFTLSISNGDLHSSGAPTGKKLSPTCIHAAVEVEPDLFEGSLQGDYSYTWSSTDDTVAKLNETGTFGFNGIAAFTTPDTNVNTVGNTAVVSVNVASGYTGSTSIDDVESKSIEIELVENLWCEPTASAHPDGWASDFNMGDYPWGPNTQAPGEGLDGGGAVKMTVVDGGEADPSNKTTIVRQVWNNLRNYHTELLANAGSAIGKKFKFYVWAKVKPADATGDVNSGAKLTHRLLPWSYQDGPSGPGFDKRFEAQGIVSAELKATTDWQLVEFKFSDLQAAWTVPANWTIRDHVFPFFDIEGLQPGDVLLLDDYAIVEVTE